MPQACSSWYTLSKASISWYTLSEISSGVRRRGRGVRNNKKEAGMAGSALSIDQLLQHLLLLVGDSHCRMLCRVEKVSLATWRPEFQMSPRVPCLRLRLLPIAVSEDDGGPSARHYFPPIPISLPASCRNLPCPMSLQLRITMQRKPREERCLLTGYRVHNRYAETSRSYLFLAWSKQSLHVVHVSGPFWAMDRDVSAVSSC